MNRLGNAILTTGLIASVCSCSVLACIGRKLRRQQVKMVYAFDTLAYSKRLRDKGVPQEQAEAHAEAIREFVMADLATKADLQALRSDLQALSGRLDAKVDRFEAKLDTLSLRLTVRLGAMLVVGLGALATILKLT
jgi:hypothetical protein